MYRITYKARGEFGGSFETVANSPAELQAILKSLRADPNVYDIKYS